MRVLYWARLGLARAAITEGLQAVPGRNYPPAFVVRKDLNPMADIVSGRLAGADGFLYWSRGKYFWRKR